MQTAFMIMLVTIGLVFMGVLIGITQSDNVPFNKETADGTADFSVSKEHIQVTPKDGRLYVKLPVNQEGNHPISGSLRVRILDEKDEAVTVKTGARTVPVGTSWLEIDPESDIPIDELIYHRLSYEFQWDKGRHKGIISLSRILAQLEIRAVGQSEFYAGGPASIRLILSDHSSKQPVSEAQTTIALLQEDKVVAQLFSGETNENGTIDASFDLPSDLEPRDYRLEIKAVSEQGQDRLVQPIRIKRGFQIMLTTDKPLYQPGQLIHIRSLTLQKPTLQSADKEPILIEVEDSKGNKVFKRPLETDAFGIAAADFQLADEINMGTYKIRAQLGNTVSEKSVNVERYVLPKFNINFKPDKDFYQPGDKMTGEITADYFFGKPVDQGKVEVTLSKFDVGFEEFARISGQIQGGVYRFDTRLPDYFVGQPLEQGGAFVQINLKVTDSADHTQEKSEMVKVAKNPLIIHLVPESGSLAPSIENRVYALVSYPDGSPAQVDLNVSSEGADMLDAHGKVARKKPIIFQTDESGIVEISITPTSDRVQLNLTARDKQGQTGTITFNSKFLKTGQESILLRPDKAIYRVGETMNLTAFTTRQNGVVYIDFVKDRQTVLTRSVKLENGRAEMNLDIPAELSGNVRATAYVIGKSGSIIRDWRLIYIGEATDLVIKTEKKLGKKSDENAVFYHPGNDVELEFEVTDGEGHPVFAALGIQIVDEAVFALSEMQPGLEKVYFRLEKEIMEPRYEIHGFTPKDIVKTSRDKNKAESNRQRAASILLASVEDFEPFLLDVNSFAKRKALIHKKAREVFMVKINKISNALSEYTEKYNAVPTKKEGWAKLIVEKMLTQDDLIDPWGNPLQFNFYSDVMNYFYVGSWGPDEKKGSLDDLTHEIYVEWKGEKKGSFWEKWFGWMNFAKGEKRLFQARVGNMDMEGDMMMMEMSDAAPPGAIKNMKEQDGGGGGGEKQVRVRQYFPETLLNVPSLITDRNGRASLNFKIADSITDWRITGMANSQSGQLGSMTESLRCFQDFFIDIDLPVSLTQNDRVSIPIAVYNYLPTSQEVRLQMEPGDWFEIDSNAEKVLAIDSGEVGVVYFPIRVVKIGLHALTLYGHGEKMSDAVKRTIEVIPDGKEFLINVDNRVQATGDGSGEGKVKQRIYIPEGAIPDASKIFVKVYPGAFSQLVEGLDAIFGMPFGCFEQTSSVTYPNVLALDYLRSSGKSVPEIEMQAEEYINLGYQRLLSFEVDGGGFEWFGNAPANQLLTAYGLMQFHDMNKVYEIDPAVIKRTQNWLVSRQSSDGSWGPDKQYLHLESWGRIKDSNLMITAYVAWALAESDYRGSALDKALTYIRNNLDKAEDPYVMAFIANALVTVDKNHGSTNEIFDQILQAKIERDDQIFWETHLNTACYSHGDGANLETTAMIAQAMLKWGKHSQTTNKVLNYIVAQKSPNGIWQTTQATIMSLKALLMSIASANSDIAADVRVIINGEDAETLEIRAEDADVMRLVDLKQQTLSGENYVELLFTGSGSMMYSIIGRYYLPWDNPDVAPGASLLNIHVAYDKTELSTDDLVTASVSVKMTESGRTDMIIVDLGIPPGFEVMSGDLEELVGSQNIQKFSLTGRQIIIYIDKLESDKPVLFDYRLRAKYPITAQSRSSRVYEYYNPDVQDIVEPEELKIH
ncbi:MAG: hypothetical protein B6244_10060 [Candidatus Cloacimonetes bacterium 4572_55]|nr:MAG: hypothetical protein B6244_10060 [Candidatus Cloacimonetes bacterium 4572_55]